MEFGTRVGGRAREITELFEATFSASEGPEEGRLIGALAKKLMETTPVEDLYVFSAIQNGELVGSAFFSRLIFEEDERTVFLLSPVAVKTDRQGQGVGQSLLNFGLKQLRDSGVDVAITYGDPDYYCKVGFAPIKEDVAKPPLPLKQPIGWLAQSLSHCPVGHFRGESRCVDALNDPVYW